ncbi:MAG: flagella basal body P-ring formation protein FlgA [Betaproteobacteria bacterium]|mgnify:CR=1 FL=1|jgi:flagellar basal body P-ring formation protein FlgA|nr:flagella basal body P-ring formation protein FlgA [Betaproteobacteria bacterium]NBP43640.1 flagella basal body P-ring formation protein FlgA [Betaproteobacteria bacterium]
MLCPLHKPLSSSPAPARVVGVSVLTLTLLSMSAAGLAQSSEGRAMLFQSATEWVSQQNRLDPASIQFNPLDERVRIAACRQPIQFDQPLGNPNTLRARCTQPYWQHWLSFYTQAPQRAQAAVQQRDQNREVWVANQLIRRGTLVTPDMFERRNMDISNAETALIQSPEDLKNVELLRDMQPGSPIRSHDLKPAMLVKRGQVVLVSMGEGRGFLVTVRAESQQDGRLGELIRLKNPESGRLLSAMVTGPNSARGM